MRQGRARSQDGCSRGALHPPPPLPAGTVRMKNHKNILLKNVIDACVSTLAWWSVGYAFAVSAPCALACQAARLPPPSPTARPVLPPTHSAACWPRCSMARAAMAPSSATTTFSRAVRRGRRGSIVRGVLWAPTPCCHTHTHRSPVTPLLPAARAVASEQGGTYWASWLFGWAFSATAATVRVLAALRRAATVHACTGRVSATPPPPPPPPSLAMRRLCLAPWLRGASSGASAGGRAQGGGGGLSGLPASVRVRKPRRVAAPPAALRAMLQRLPHLHSVHLSLHL